ncbi:MAG: cytochrome C peroxidase [Nitrosomonas sp.]|nr:MAG: cytochrome C peroxidase [Nitrosomonas sp.]
MITNPSKAITIIGLALIAGNIFFLQTTAAQTSADPARPPSLKTVPVPQPSNLEYFVKNKHMAIVLGKALFWDMHVGTDGLTACATCHFNAGADSRSKNQVNPGLNRVLHDASLAPDKEFDYGPNRQLVSEDFPFRELSNKLDRSSAPLRDSNDVVSSQGVFAMIFKSIKPGSPVDNVRHLLDDAGFRINHINVRRVEPRNAPTVINAVFNFRNFLDGRAQNEFNGINNWGARDPDAHVYRARSATRLERESILIDNASLASAAVAPPTNTLEMSAKNRPFPMIGRKLIHTRPLVWQKIHPQDSVLGDYSRWPQAGLSKSYQELIRAAFQPQWWQSAKRIKILTNGNTQAVNFRQHRDQDADEFSLMEYNFSLFFGLATQLYMATLIVDDTPYDRFMAGDATAISDAAIRGVDLFRSQTRGRCINCHEGAELTGASVTRVQASPIRIRDGQAFDRGFNNIGIRPSSEDIALGGMDPFGQPLSYTRSMIAPDCAENRPCPIVADGFFKVPGLRNVTLTAPYFHNGGTALLRDVLDLYSRGGDFPELTQLDDSMIMPLNVLFNSETEKDDLEAWLHALTDERVRNRQAPFDHPQIFIPNGHPGDENQTKAGLFGNAVDQFIEIPAVGREGGKPLKQFLE